METLARRRGSIEKEFDEPIRDIVAGFVKMGLSTACIADALEVSKPSLYKFIRRENIPLPRYPQQKIRTTGRPPRMIEHNGRRQSLTAWSLDLGVTPPAVLRRIRKTGRPTG